MKLNTMRQVVKAVEHTHVSKNGRIMYTISFKKALMEFMEDKNKTTLEISDNTGITAASINRWKHQHSLDLYNLDSAFTVSPRSRRTNFLIRSKLNNEIDSLGKKISMLKRYQTVRKQLAEFD